MAIQSRKLQVLTMLTLLFLLAGCRPEDDNPPKAAKVDVPKPLPPEIVKAWKDAGATVGWLALDEYGSQKFRSQDDGFEERSGAVGVVPAFEFTFPPRKEFAKLPDAGMAFGLSFYRVTEMTDSDLKQLSGLKSLHGLNLGETKVTDSGLKELTALKNLQWLYLWNTKVSDAGLKDLAELKSLRSLYLAQTRITGAGLKDLAGLKSLQRLSLYFTPVTDVGLKELAGMNGLKGLDLFNTRVTDAGLKELAGLNNLQSLRLAHTQVTDAGLKELARLKSLKELNLDHTKNVTENGVAALQKELPACKIHRSTVPAP